MNLFVSLRYLVALDDHRHFGRAALACHVTQPALSNALKSLEDSFGTSIVKRARHFAGFTPEGERILVSARRILHEHEGLQQDLHSTRDAPRGNLMVGAVPTTVPIAARFVALLQVRHPGIVPTLRSISSAELERGLDGLSLDLGLGYSERVDARRPALRTLPQYVERYYLLRRRAAVAAPNDVTDAAAASTLRTGAPIGWADAADLPLCLMSAEMHNRTIVDRAFAAAGRRPQVAIETNSIVTLTLAVRAGRVCSVMPGALVDAAESCGELEALPLIEPHVEVPIGFLVNDANRPSRTLQAALALATDADWLREAERHAGALDGRGR